MSKEKKIKASDYKCVECGKQAEVWYQCYVGSDIPPYPYGRKCAEKARKSYFLDYSEKKNKQKMHIGNQMNGKYF